MSHEKLAVLNVLASAILLGCLSGCSRSNVIDPTTDDAKIASTLQANGIMSRGDYFRVAKLRRQLEGGENLSEGDLDWLLALGNRRSAMDQRAQQIRMVNVGQALAFHNPSQLPASRTMGVINFAVRMVNSGDTQDSLPWNGCFLLARLKDKRTIPYLTPLMSSSDPNVRVEARRAVHRLSQST